MIRRSLLRAVLGLAAALGPMAGHSQPTPLALKSESIDLPFGEHLFPARPGSDVMDSNCVACHSTGMVLNQPALPRATWAAEVQKMINVYKARVAAEDIPAIVDYLDALKGTGAKPQSP